MPQQTKRLTYFSVMMNMLTGGRAYSGGPASPAGFLTLTTTGRKTGRQRTVRLIYLRDGSDYVVTASNGGRPRPPGWFFNLSSNPRVSLEVHGAHRSAMAEIATPAQRQALWPQLVAIAPMFAGYQRRTTREIPMVLLHPVDTPGVG